MTARENELADRMKAHCEFLAAHASGFSLAKWNDISNAMLAAASTLRANAERIKALEEAPTEGAILDAINNGSMHYDGGAVVRARSAVRECFERARAAQSNANV